MRPCRDKPNSRAARARLPPARASASSMNRRSKPVRASARDVAPAVIPEMTLGSSEVRT
jgi:hypothetical protein